MPTELYKQTYGQTWEEVINQVGASVIPDVGESVGATMEQTTTDLIKIPDNSKLYYPEIVGGRFIGGYFKTGNSNARLEIFPDWDKNIGIVVYDNQTISAKVFEIIIDGTDVGDVQIGNYSGGQGLLYDKSTGLFDFKGGISAGSLAIGTSPNWYKVDANGNVWLGQDTLALAQANTIAFLNTGVAYIRNIVLTGLVAGSAVDMTYITNPSFLSLSALSASLGTITAGNITLDTSGFIRSGATGYMTGTGWWVGYDTSAYKLHIGNPSGNYMSWNGTTLKLKYDDYFLNASGNRAMATENASISGLGFTPKTLMIKAQVNKSASDGIKTSTFVFCTYWQVVGGNIGNYVANDTTNTLHIIDACVTGKYATISITSLDTDGFTFSAVMEAGLTAFNWYWVALG